MAPPKRPQSHTSGFDGTEGNAAVAADPPPVDPASDRPVHVQQVPAPPTPVPPAATTMRLVGLVLRIVVAVMTLIATIVMGTSEEQMGFAEIKSTGPGMSQLKYFIAVNTIACAYALASIALNATIMGPSMVSLLINIGDVLMVSFLFSGIGSASAMSVFLKNGIGGTQSGVSGVCDVFGKMCAQTDAAIALSSLGVFTLLSLVLISIFNFHRSSN